MKKFASISVSPGKTGTFFYSSFFKKYNIDASYEAFAASEDNFFTVLNELKEKNYNGISISMPFKTTVIDYLRKYGKLTKNVVDYNSCNTILFDKEIVGYNADLNGVIEISKLCSPKIAILGSGAMGNMFYDYLSLKFYVDLFSRRKPNWHNRHEPVYNTIINCTEMGTTTTLSPLDYIPSSTKLVVDLSLKSNDLYTLCNTSSINYLSGLDFYKYQFMEQFYIYTDIKITEVEFDDVAKLYKSSF